MTKSRAWHNLMAGRVTFLAVVFLVFLLMLVLRLWQVQIVQETDHIVAVERESLRPERINAVRGRIYASGGEALVDNQSVYDLGFYVSEMRRPGRMRHTINHILAGEKAVMAAIGRESVLTASILERHIRVRSAQPVIVAENLTEEEMAKFAEMFPAVEGARIIPRVYRWYPHPGVASHLLGYTGWNLPDGKDISEDFPRLFVSRELVGRTGLEKAFDNALKGQPGARLHRVDSIGYVREDVGGEQLPENGDDLFLTIDLVAQQAAEKVLDGHVGALVAVDVNTGAILALASSPTYDLATLTGEKIVQMGRDEISRPMVNRATQGVYMPGSIVKPLMALALLENGVVTAEDEYDCIGYFKLGSHRIRCARRWGHGILSLQEAISVSCNPYFIAGGVQCGIDNLAPFFAAAGFGERSGFEIYDAAGIAPAREIAERYAKRSWTISDTAYASIGQGLIEVTPLQAAMYAAALANGGTLYRPYVISEIRTQEGELLQHSLPVVRNRLPVKPENLAIVREAMHMAVTSSDGGARGLAGVDLDLAGKTGTAEVGYGENRHKNTWTIAFGPYADPQYAVACIIERGNTGGSTTVPIVAEFFRLWLTAQ